MRISKFLVSLFILVIFTLNLSAQEAETRYGIGVNFAKDFVLAAVGGADYSFMSLPYDFSNISIVFRSPKVRLEPSVGYFRYSISNGTERSLSDWRLGLNLAVNNVTGNMHHYYGINIGVILSSISVESGSSSSDESKTDFFIGPLIGGEYNFSEYLSLGGEVQFNYISLGQYDEDSDASESALTTRAIIILRWYFK